MSHSKRTPARSLIEKEGFIIPRPRHLRSFEEGEGKHITSTALEKKRRCVCDQRKKKGGGFISSQLYAETGFRDPKRRKERGLDDLNIRSKGNQQGALPFANIVRNNSGVN